MTCRSKIAIIIPIRNPSWPPSWKSIFRFFYCTEMPVDSKFGRRHWGWLVLLMTFWKFQHFNLVSKIFQKLFKPLPCHKSIGKMLHAICISAVAVSLRWASCGPWASCLNCLLSRQPTWKVKPYFPQKFKVTKYCLLQLWAMLYMLMLSPVGKIFNMTYWNSFLIFPRKQDDISCKLSNRI